MEITRKLPIGVQSFQDLREKDFIYVDKTQYIFRLIDNAKVYFLSRPRRFGKSLFLSTLKAYFLGQKELFKGLAIESWEEAQADQRAIWQEYPVLYLDFNAESYRDVSSLETILHTHLALWEKEYGTEPAENSFSSRFAGICGITEAELKQCFHIEIQALGERRRH